MSKFKVGDEVVRMTQSLILTKGNVYTVSGVDQYGQIKLEGFHQLWISDRFGLHYPNPPHKHYDLIIAWANGAEIEYYSEHCEDWKKPNGSPCWGEDIKYRIKPRKTKKEIQIEQLEKEARELADRITKLKEE